MTISFNPARPGAVLTAIAVIAAGLALAPVSTASAASPSSKVVSGVNKYRAAADLSKLTTQSDVTEFATEIAASHAKEKVGTTTSVDFNGLQFIAPEPENYEFHGYRFTGGSSTVAAALVKKLKADSGRTAGTGVYGDFTHVGIGLVKSGKYTYAEVFLAKYTAKLQDSHEPRITGTAAVGKTLKVDLNGWKVAGGQLNYQWYTDGGTVGLASAPLVIESDLVGKRIYVSVEISRDGYYSIYRASDRTAKVAQGTIGTTPTPKVTGSRVVGDVLTATVGTWSTGSELTYRWKRNGVAIADATSTTYEQVAADRGKKITFSVTAKKPGYKTVTKTSSSPTVTLGLFTAPVPQIDVPAETVGTVLTAKVGAWSPKASSYSYQWYRDGVPINKATSKTYKTVAADVEAELWVRVTGKKTGYKTLAIISDGYIFGILL